MDSTKVHTLIIVIHSSYSPWGNFLALDFERMLLRTVYGTSIRTKTLLVNTNISTFTHAQKQTQYSRTILKLSRLESSIVSKRKINGTLQLFILVHFCPLQQTNFGRHSLFFASPWFSCQISTCAHRVIIRNTINSN